MYDTSIYKPTEVLVMVNFYKVFEQDKPELVLSVLYVPKTSHVKMALA